MTITDIKNLIIKLNVAIDAEHEKASVQGALSRCQRRLRLLVQAVQGNGEKVRRTGN